MATLKPSGHKLHFNSIETTLQHCRLARQHNQNVALTLAKTNKLKSTYFRVTGQLDSALHFATKGLSQEMRFWRTQELYKASEAAQIHRNEQREEQLTVQKNLLIIEQKRSLGLIAFSGIILLFGLGTVYLYGQLKKSNELIKNQAITLENKNLELADSLKLQVMLKAELKHRVKNNMQLILSLLNRHQGSIEDPELKSIFSERKDQIESIALVHQKIDLQANDREVDPEEYLGELIANIERSYSGIFPEVKLNLALAADLIHIDAAVPLGLILNELVTNAYKYAFPKGGSGNIDVTFAKLPNHFYLRVSDDGVGLPEDIAFRRSNSMGTRLIKGLTRQLEGTAEWIPSHPGLIVQIKFSAFLPEFEV